MELSNSVKKQEDVSDGSNDPKSGDKRDLKPVVKTTSRVPRACNACRKQKMRCEGADNPPCRRCRHANLECLFEKPTREATLTGEAGLERIRSLEAHVAEIRHSQSSIQNSLAEIVAHLRTGTFQPRSPSVYPPFHNHSPNVNSTGSPVTPTPPAGQPAQLADMHAAGGSSSFSAQHANSAHHRSNPAYRSPSVPSGSNQVSPNPGEFHSQTQNSYLTYAQSAQAYGNNHNPHSSVLPPFSSIQTSSRSGHGGRYQRSHIAKRPAVSSTVTSAESSDIDDDENGELPASGLLAPWEVLRGLADVATERAAKENGDSSEPHSRTRTPSPERQSRPTKRRKLRHKAAHYTDVVTKNIIPESEARELFRIFYQGCSTFLPVFDSNMDTFEALHERSPFAVDCICMVAARVRDAGGKPSEIYNRCYEEVQAISCATLFSPVARPEAVQAMILVSGWSDNGWLSGGHAVRMAMELSMHKAWPKLLKRMKSNKSNPEDDRDLVIASRTWFCLYLFEHQLSYGTGRPAILKDDESIFGCRALLQHPLAIEDDMRLVSTVELMALREKVHNNLTPLDQPLDGRTFQILHEAADEFKTWFATWDQAFSQKYDDEAFYRQSLQNQQLHAELFHNATALRGINGPDDVQKMPPAQRELAIRSIRIAQQGLQTTISAPSYREGMRYAVHYTHVAATFTASFLLRLARLFPDECNMDEIRAQVERLAELMNEIPGRRYAVTLQLMLKRGKKRKTSATASAHTNYPHPPNSQPHRVVPSQMEPPVGIPAQHEMHHHPHQNAHHGGHHPTHSHQYSNQYPRGNVEALSPTNDPSYETQMQAAHMGMYPPGRQVDAEHIWRGFEMTSTEQLPVWLSDQSLGGSSFTQNGMESFVMPTDYLSAPQVW